MLRKNSQKGFTLVEIVIVIAIIGILAAVTVVVLKPQEIFQNGRNSRRTNDVSSINTAVGQWFNREGQDPSISDPYDELGLTATGVTAITPADGIAGEGVDANTVTELTSAGYLQSIPTDPSGNQYRIGVDDVTNPSHILVCTDQVEFTSTYPETSYPNGVFCQSN